MHTTQILRISTVRPPPIGEVVQDVKDVEDIEDCYLHHLQNDSLWLSSFFQTRNKKRYGTLEKKKVAYFNCAQMMGVHAHSIVDSYVFFIHTRHG